MRSCGLKQGAILIIGLLLGAVQAEHLSKQAISSKEWFISAQPLELFDGRAHGSVQRVLNDYAAIGIAGGAIHRPRSLSIGVDLTFQPTGIISEGLYSGVNASVVTELENAGPHPDFTQVGASDDELALLTVLSPYVGYQWVLDHNFVVRLGARYNVVSLQEGTDENQLHDFIEGSELDLTLGYHF